jgi:hypothetical protein
MTLALRRPLPGGVRQDAMLTAMLPAGPCTTIPNTVENLHRAAKNIRATSHQLAT